jgi:hypothetical protein
MLDGQPWDGLSVATEGTHQLDVAVTDTAGNRTQPAATFVIDRTAPVIAFLGFNDGGFHNTPVTPVVTIGEPNL